MDMYNMSFIINLHYHVVSLNELGNLQRHNMMYLSIYPLPAYIRNTFNDRNSWSMYLAMSVLLGDGG